MIKPEWARERLIQARSRIAEIDLMIQGLQMRRKKIADYCGRLSQEKIDLGPDVAAQTADYSAEFETAWALYAELTGRRVEKKAAFARFKKISADQYPFILKAIKNYGASREARRGFTKHFKRFLQDDFLFFLFSS